jgi:hypothetical protein
MICQGCKIFQIVSEAFCKGVKSGFLCLFIGVGTVTIITFACFKSSGSEV